MSYKGRYKVQNISKYRGDPTKVFYRSLWERTFMRFCDSNPNVLEWSSEEVVVPYYSSLDNKMHRYFVDFFVNILEKDGQVRTKLIEIKPHKQTIEPIKKKKKTRAYLNEVTNFIINTHKWEAASAYCKKQGWEFMILTEKQLFGKNGDSNQQQL